MSQNLLSLIAESAKIASDGKPLKFIGFNVSDKLAIEPSRIFIRRTKRKEYMHPTQGEFGGLTAPLHQIIPGDIADGSVIVDVLFWLS